MRMLIICSYSSIRARHKSNSFALWCPQKFNVVENQHWVSPDRLHTPARRYSWHPPTGSGSSHWGTFPRVSKRALAQPSPWRESPAAESRGVRRETKSIADTASTTCPVQSVEARWRNIRLGKTQKVPPSFVGPMCDYSNRWRVKVGLQSAGGRLASPKCWRSEDLDALHHI